MTTETVEAVHLNRDGWIEDVIRREASALLAYFERRCPIDDAPDLLGETLLVAWRRADAMPTVEHEARMWLFGVARRVLGTSRRSQIRRHALVERLRLHAQLRTEPARGRDDDLHEALASLPPIDAEIIRLLHWDGFTLAEIAALRRPYPAQDLRRRQVRGAVG